MRTRERPDRFPLRAVAIAFLATVASCRGGAAPPEDDAGADRSTPAPRVLLVGIDGVRADVLAEVPTPNLDALAADGLLVTNARTTRPSVSGPAWSSMLTGVWPDKHGVTNNEFTGARYDVYPDFLTRIERSRPELSTAAIVDWLPLARRDAGTPAISDAVDERHVLDGYDLGWAEADAQSVERAVELLRDAGPHALFVYLGNPDETSHEHGSIGAEYRAAIELADRHVGALVEAVLARSTYADERWLILASTDHGRRSDGGHGGDSPEEMTIWVLAHGLAGVDPAALGRVDIVDVAPTALTHLGLGLDSAWALDGTPLQGR